MPIPDIDIASLTNADRLALIERLWDSIDEEALVLTPVQREVLDERVAQLDADREAGRPLGIPWEDIKASWKSERPG